MVGSGGVGVSEGLWSLIPDAVELIEMNPLSLPGGNYQVKALGEMVPIVCSALSWKPLRKKGSLGRGPSHHHKVTEFSSRWSRLQPRAGGRLSTKVLGLLALGSHSVLSALHGTAWEKQKGDSDYVCQRWPEVNFSASHFCLKTPGWPHLFVYIQSLLWCQRSWTWVHHSTHTQVHKQVRTNKCVCICILPLLSFIDYLENSCIVCVTGTWSGRQAVSLKLMVVTGTISSQMNKGGGNVSHLELSQLGENQFENPAGSVVGLTVQGLSSKTWNLLFPLSCT